jgi:predicted Zn-dependent protease
MLGEGKLKEIAKQALSYSKADQTEILLMVHDRGLTRFANSQIHQNVSHEEVFVQVRAIIGPSAGSGQGARIGVASTNKLDKESLKKIVENANLLVRLQKKDPHFKSLPKPQKITRVGRFSQKTAQLGTAKKAKIVVDIIKVAKEKNLTASGAFDTSISEIAVANSNGVWAYHPSTSVSLSTILLGDDSSGFAAEYGKDVSKIDHLKVAARAAEKAIRSKNPKAVKTGDWEVILEPAAVDEILSFFAWLGPNARIYHEEASFLTGKLGEKVFSDKLTIWDDALDARGLCISFDFEGHPKAKIPIIEKGVFKNIVYDSYHAGKHGEENTGHALPAPNTCGPIPGHLRFETGDLGVEDMIKRVKRGLLVSRFWYIRMLHPKILNITGMTRDGTFLIKNGEISGAVKNMRFTQSIPEAFANVAEVGNELKLEAGFGGSNLIPALHIGKFHFSGVTQF